MAQDETREEVYQRAHALVCETLGGDPHILSSAPIAAALQALTDAGMLTNPAELSRLRAENERQRIALADAMAAPHTKKTDELIDWAHELLTEWGKGLTDRMKLRAELGEARKTADWWFKIAQNTARRTALEVDGEDDAWYIQLLDEPVARTTEQRGPVNVDWTRDGRMVGVEILPAQAGTGDTAAEAELAALEVLTGPRNDLLLDEWAEQTMRRILDRQQQLRVAIAARPTGDTAQPGDNVIEQAARVAYEACAQHAPGDYVPWGTSVDVTKFWCALMSSVADAGLLAAHSCPSTATPDAGISHNPVITATEPATELEVPADAPTHAGLLRDARHVGHAGPIDGCTLCGPARPDTEDDVRSWNIAPEPKDVAALCDDAGNTWVRDQYGWTFPEYVGRDDVRTIPWRDLLEGGPLTEAPEPARQEPGQGNGDTGLIRVERLDGSTQDITVQRHTDRAGNHVTSVRPAASEGTDR